MTSNSDIIEKIEKDEFLQYFLTDNASHARHTTNLSLTEQIQRLTDGLHQITSVLQSQVRDKHGALLSQASHAGKLTAALNAVSSHMERLQDGAERLKKQITEPYNRLESQTKVLERLHGASHLLRKIGRFLQIYRKLQLTKDLTIQASFLYELEPLLDDPEFNRIDFIREEKGTVRTARQRLNNIAHRDLNSGLKNLNENQIIKSLQIFANLSMLDKCIDDLLTTFMSDIEQSIKDSFSGADIASLKVKSPVKSKDSAKNPIRGPGKVSSLTNSQNFRSKLWAAIEWLFDDEIFAYCAQVILLQKSLSKLQINSLSRPFEQQNIEERFWTSLEKLFKKSLTDCAPHINQTLQQGLPQLLGNVRSFQVKVGQRFIFQDSTFESLETGYLEKCGANLKAPFIGVTIPTQENVDALIRAASTELSAAMVDNRLSILVANAFIACNGFFWSMLANNIKLEAEQVVDVPSPSQIQNKNLANIGYYHAEEVYRMVQNLGSNFSNTKAAQKIRNEVKVGNTITDSVLGKLFDTIDSTVNIILLSLHREPGLNNENLSPAGPSLYMKELNDFLLRAFNLHVAGFNDKQCTEKFGRDLVARSIELFVRNLAIIRPLSLAGRNRLKNDCQHFEVAFKPFVVDLSTIGRPYRLLRAISSLIILKAENLAVHSTDFDGPVPTYIILLLLFSYAGNDLASPHIAAGWSNEKLISWLDGHVLERERLELVSGALQKYRTIVRQKNIAQYDPVYPVISKHLELVLKVIK